MIQQNKTYVSIINLYWLKERQADSIHAKKDKNKNYTCFFFRLKITPFISVVIVDSSVKSKVRKYIKIMDEQSFKFF